MNSSISVEFGLLEWLRVQLCISSTLILGIVFSLRMTHENHYEQLIRKSEGKSRLLDKSRSLSDSFSLGLRHDSHFLGFKPIVCQNYSMNFKLHAIYARSVLFCSANNVRFHVNHVDPNRSLVASCKTKQTEWNRENLRQNLSGWQIASIDTICLCMSESVGISTKNRTARRLLRAQIDAPSYQNN